MAQSSQPSTDLAQPRFHTPLALPLILLLAVGVRVVLVVLWTAQVGSESFGFGDSISYWRLAQAIGTGESYEFGWEGARCFRTPGYPLWLSSLYWIWSEPPILAARALGVAVGVGVVAATFAVAERFGGRPIAILASLIVAVHPELALSSGLVLSESLFELLLLLQGLAWLRRREAVTPKSRWRGAAELGVWCALSVLVRPSWLIAAPGWSLALLCIASGPRPVLLSRNRSTESKPSNHRDHSFSASEASGPGIRERLMGAIAFSLAFVVVMSPWWVRNAVTFGTFVPTTLQTGASLYDAWNPEATGGSDMRLVDAQRLSFLRQIAGQYLEPDELEVWTRRLPTHPESTDYWPRIRTEVPKLWRRLLEIDHSLPEFEVAFDRYLSGQANSWAKANPRRVMELAGNKVLRLWSPWPQEGLGRSAAIRILFAVVWVGLLGTLLFGARPAMRWPDAWILVAPALLFTLLHMVYVASIRYREPALPGLAIMAALGIASIASRLPWGKTGAFR